MSNKLKNTRVVTFKEDYTSKAGATTGGEPIARKGSVHAMHVNVAAMLKDKGAKIDIKEFDAEGAIKRAKARLAENRKKEKEMTYA